MSRYFNASQAGTFATIYDETLEVLKARCETYGLNYTVALNSYNEQIARG